MRLSAPAAGSTRTELIQAKGFPYTLQELLIDPQLVELYRDGQYATLRLTPSMYHRFHAPFDCIVDKVTYVSGDTWNVNPIALNRIPKLFCKNERAVIRTTLRPVRHRGYPGACSGDSRGQHPAEFSGCPVEHAVPRESRNSVPGALLQRRRDGLVPARVDDHRICAKGCRVVQHGAAGCGHPHGQAS